MWAAWKSAEKQVARVLGGLRRSRGYNFGDSIEDVIHSEYAIEVKYGNQVPKWVRYPKPFITNDYAVVSLDNYALKVVRRQVKRVKFVEDGLKQALSYDSTGRKVALLVMKPRGYRGLIFAMKREDLGGFIGFLRMKFLVG